MHRDFTALAYLVCALSFTAITAVAESISSAPRPRTDAAAPSPSPSPVDTAAPPALVLGDFDDDYDNHFSVTATEFRQGTRTVYEVISWHVADQYLIARNGATNPSDQGKFTRIDWLPLPNMAPYSWAFCLSVFDAPTSVAAESVKHIDRTTPRTGCNGFPFSRMKRVASSVSLPRDTISNQRS